ncbi:hypothetical protein NM688_g984 [Phlebia brevispora]|uniref:Uncharacterized protein n=1 Tax=Phlebia brevispora TaxID=194682 RepID=A0ACC1TCX7_9APHY|nr:hypothetical protein NM688_g984 [Phlebia brevispora]
MLSSSSLLVRRNYAYEVMCGKWESYPREFAKCRRCRKAKYCGKECQSIAWSEGHRFWCSAKDPEEDPDHHGESSRTTPGASSSAAQAGTSATAASTTTTTTGGTAGRAERRARDPAMVVAEFGPRIMNPSPLAQVAETVRQGPLNLDNPRRDVAGATTGTPTAGIGNLPQWSFNSLALRRMRPRVDEAGEPFSRVGLPASPTTTTNVSPHGAGRRTDSVATIRPMDVELSPEVRRHLVQIIDGGRRTERIDVTPAAIPMEVTVAGPSRIRDPTESDNDEPMVIG